MMRRQGLVAPVTAPVYDMGQDVVPEVIRQAVQEALEPIWEKLREFQSYHTGQRELAGKEEEE